MPSNALVSPSGRRLQMPGSFDGDRTWRVRFSPDGVGDWAFRTWSRPVDPGLDHVGRFVVTARETRGFLTATPGRAWGFAYENGEPVFLFGDTVYNLFGLDYCGMDVALLLERRTAQGFNVPRMRVPVSRFHPPAGAVWSTWPTWPWGGSDQWPLFDRFNRNLFQSVDRVVRLADDLGMGLELIMEQNGSEFPFNSRHVFVAEWEEL